ncbi:MAG: UDP-N-acetylmuramoyl-L-alanyl-D-glutamate--2,6-diaminopimelate ligase [Thermoanaerobaculales bacterium]|nr:UDP-N-acetylmuramoyl-L-alanyl-D-glutamate--2,6-diaminopimelate ligase [Thermoanaerobaculales bacterium]
MTLAELLPRLSGARLMGDGGCRVSGITHDSRLTMPGIVFAAVPGLGAHGLDFLDQAIEHGASAVLTDRPRPQSITLPWLQSENPRRDMAEAAWILAGEPQRDLHLIGITGTNGKSTVAHLVSLIFGAAGRPCGFLGTLGLHLPGGEIIPGERTTPEATDLALQFRHLVDDGGQALAMEVSSHALVQERLAGLKFNTAVFTNLSRDHLDFHGDMEDYFEAKKLLFDQHLEGEGRRVLPADEPWGARLLAESRSGDVSWGLSEGDVHARNFRLNLEGCRFTLTMGGMTQEVSLGLIGEHNMRNALAAAAAAWAAGVAPEAVATGLNRARPLPGRLERIETDAPFPVFVDYAHTPDGLRAVLSSLRSITERRLIVVFGAGGDRDSGKRGPMGRSVGELAHLPVVTSDNPRTEDPASIALAVAQGVRNGGGRPEVVLDRREAIKYALEEADENSLVVVAGKGHEAEQTIGNRRLPFSDATVISELLKENPCS